MSSSQPLPVIMPAVPGQKWSCHSCGECCRTPVHHILEEERRRIEQQGWAERLGVEPYVRVGRGWALNKMPNGDCVFLDENTQCRIHAEYGEEAKPFVCKMFPFSVRAVRDGWQVSFRFDCPSMAASKGKPIERARSALVRLVSQLNHRMPSEDDLPALGRGVRATANEIGVLIARYVGWITNDSLTMGERLIGVSRITATLEGATLGKVRGQRFTELLDLLFSALPTECVDLPGAPARRQSGMLRQLVFAHAEHVSLGELCTGRWGRLRKKWQQLGSAKRFLAGRGVVPRLPGTKGDVTFQAVEAVKAPIERQSEIADLLVRYLSARLYSRSVFGGGYYNWPVFAGLNALWLSVAAAGWVGRYIAAGECRASLNLDDFAAGVGVIDRAATRLPAVGTTAERARQLYLSREDGVARLVWHFGPAGE